MTDVFVKNEKDGARLGLIPGGLFQAGGPASSEGLLSHQQSGIAGDPVRQVGIPVGGWRRSCAAPPEAHRYG